MSEALFLKTFLEFSSSSTPIKFVICAITKFWRINTEKITVSTIVKCTMDPSPSVISRVLSKAEKIKMEILSVKLFGFFTK